MKRALIVTAAVIVLGGMITASIVRDSRRQKGEKVYAEAVQKRSSYRVLHLAGKGMCLALSKQTKASRRVLLR